MQEEPDAAAAAGRDGCFGLVGGAELLGPDAAAGLGRDNSRVSGAARCGARACPLVCGARLCGARLCGAGRGGTGRGGAGRSGADGLVAYRRDSVGAETASSACEATTCVTGGEVRAGRG
jgi:hypothetical protein